MNQKPFLQIIAAISLTGFLVTSLSLSGMANEQTVGISVIDGVAGSNDSWAGYSYWKDQASKSSGSDPLGTVLCKKIGNSDCSFSNNREFRADLAAPICSDAPTNCVKSIVAVLGGAEFKANFVKYLDGNRVSPIQRLGLPRGETASLWQIQGVPNSSGQENYIFSSHFSMLLENARYFETLDFSAGIIPVKIYELAGAEPSKKWNDIDQKTGESQVLGNGPVEPCFVTEKDTCYEKVDFANGARMGLTMVFDNSRIGGWFSGHLSDPSLSVKVSGLATEVQISALPTEVPEFNFGLPTAPSQQIKDVYKKYKRELDWIGFQSTDTETADFIDAFRSAAGDSATFERQMWSFRSAGQGPYNRCLNDKSKVLGMVSTNSMVYQGHPPNFSKGFLNYVVAGMHFKSDKTTVFKGQYSLIMRQSVARCLYNLGSVPLTATISVTGGENRNVATEVVSSKGDWLSLKANGFTFSKKTIKVKITKKKK